MKLKFVHQQAAVQAVVDLGCDTLLRRVSVPLTRMSGIDRIRACFQYACLKYVSDPPMNNQTVRKRSDITD
jgi:hypothetical protein